jgi:hypothetical protein
VLRLAVFSIVLTIATGPTATLLCHASCDLDSARRASGCHQMDRATSITIAGQDPCDSAIATTALVAAESVRIPRLAPQVDSDGGVIERLCQRPMAHSDSRPNVTPSSSLQRPFSLRI